MFRVLRRVMATLLLVALCAFFASACKRQESLLDPANPVHLTVWHYYNGQQLVAFDEMVNNFNQTQGRETGIFVESLSQDSVSNLAQMVLDAARGAAGAPPMPHIFGTYPDSAYGVMAMDKLTDLSAYMSQEDIAEYFPDFWQEGVIDGTPVIFPMAKSTEVLFIDQNAWDAFAGAIGEERAAAQCLSTWEGVAETAKVYYEYTDALTSDVPHDGKALLGMDSIANFVLVAMKQQGVDFMSSQDGKGAVNFDEGALRRLWDLYYPSMVRGYFCAVSPYRSDDMKIGLLMGFLGSSTGSSYFPDVVTFEDGTQAKTQLTVLPMPVMKGADRVVVQQGSGMAVSKSDERHEYASIEFLKWLTDAQRNLEFSIASGYMPVKTEALQGGLMGETLDDMQGSGDLARQKMAATFRVALEEVADYRLYYSHAFPGRLNIRYELDRWQSTAAKARADLLAAVEAGADYEEAVEAACGFAAFSAWMEDLKIQIDIVLAEVE